jgi:glycogen debranching enzyme
MLVAHTAFKGFSGRGWGECRTSTSVALVESRSLRVPVKPIKLSRTKISYLMGATLKTRYDEFKEDPEMFHGIPSTLEEISEPVIRTGHDHDGVYTEVVVPEKFEPGSIMLFTTDMDVSSRRSPIVSRRLMTDRSCRPISTLSVRRAQTRRSQILTLWTST